MDCIYEIERGFKGIIQIDILLPFIDREDTIKEITKDDLSKNVIISIFILKVTPDHDKIRGLQSYVNDYITKPFDIKELNSNIIHMNVT
jgi:DNA-binding response OmpR family regulator